jgi:acetyl esterase/lipase
VFHGGGYCVGSLLAERYFAARLAVATRAAVWTFAYRLAPEHPCPAAVDDAVVVAEAFPSAAGVAPDRIAFVGESAGGGLALTTLTQLRDRGAAPPACAVAVSPWVDLTLSGDTMRTNDGVDLVVSREQTVRWRDWYLTAATPPDDPLASPLFADLHGLPPLLIEAGSDEVLLDDALRLRRRADEAGVAVTLSVWDGNSHVFPVYPPEVMPDADAAIEEIAGFLRTTMV